MARDNERSFFVDFGIMPQETQSHSILFDQALALQQQKSWDAALATYRQLLDQSLDHGPEKLSISQASSIYHNMSAVAFEKNDLLSAYVWSKKALHLDPSNPMTQESYEHYAGQFQVPTVPRQISNYENFKKILSYGPLDAWASLSLILLLGAFALLLKKTLRDRKNNVAGNFTKSPIWPFYLTTFLALIFVVCTYVRYEDVRTPRAIIVGGPASVQTAPGENKPVIFEAPAGLEVEVLRAESAYFQVRYPGAFSGWIPQSQLELLSLSFEQK